jgi:NAD(P)-dependent dehydrogenase (short-subunit alcohol dehydrogenase family)
VPAILVTGAGRGIGRAITLRLAADGWDVYAGVRKAADGEALKTAAAAGRITPVVLDISAADDLAALATTLPDRLDALVNNAGVVVGGPIEALALDDLRRQLEVNVTAQVAVTQALLPRLRASRGRVVFVSSVSGRVSTPFSGAYNASKFALEAIADSLRVELRPWKIAVSLVEPGAIDTDIWRGALDMADETEAAMDPEVRELYAAQVKGLRKTIARTQRQAITPEKVAGAVHSALTAARPRARYVVGMDARVQLALKTALPTRALDLAIARLTGGR